MKQYDDVFKQMDNIFKEVDNVFKQIDKKMEEVQQESWDVMNKKAKWEPHVSWVPRKIGKRWFWRSPIYRKYQFDNGNGHYVYGTEFDVLRDSK